jgi:hypothetical protein
VLDVAAAARIAVSLTRTMDQRGMGDGGNEEEFNDHPTGEEMTATVTTFIKLRHGNLVLRNSNPSTKHQARGLSSSDDDIDYNPTPSAGRNNHTQQSNRVKERGGERKDESRRQWLWQKGGGGYDDDNDSSPRQQ